VNKSGTAEQVITHPQGGGAIKGLGESFAPDLRTGTANLTVPIALPPGRNKLRPDLSLIYRTGHGNGLFGFGWGLSIPGVARDAARGVPLYSDEDDVFLLSGAEQLVPTRRASEAPCSIGHGPKASSPESNAFVPTRTLLVCSSLSMRRVAVRRR